MHSRPIPRYRGHCLALIKWGGKTASGELQQDFRVLAHLEPFALFSKFLLNQFAYFPGALLCSQCIIAERARAHTLASLSLCPYLAAPCVPVARCRLRHGLTRCSEEVKRLIDIRTDEHTSQTPHAKTVTFMKLQGKRGAFNALWNSTAQRQSIHSYRARHHSPQILYPFLWCCILTVMYWKIMVY